MKKIRRIIIIASAVLLATVIAFVGIYYGRSNDSAQVTEGNSQAVMDEYLLETTNELSPVRQNSVWIKEGTDGSFTAEDEDFKRSLSVISRSVFDSIYIYVPFGEVEESGGKLSYGVSAVREIDKKAYAAFDFSVETQTIVRYGSDADGIMLICPGGVSAEEINSKAAEIKEETEKEIFVSLELGFVEFGLLDSDVISAAEFTLTNEKDSDRLLMLDGKGIELICCLDIDAVDGKTVFADVPLENLYALRDAKKVGAVSVNGLASARANLQNCFGAVKTYITVGIAPEVAFREAAILGYEGDTVTVPSYTAAIQIYGSYLFPFTVDGRNIGSSPNGNITATVDLKPGDNSFIIGQNGSEAEYKIRSSCESELVTFITPAREIYLLPSESFNVAVVAHCNAEIYIKIGTEKIKAQCECGASGYTAFTATVSAPDSEEKISSLGSIGVIAVYGDKTVQYEGAKIYLAGSSGEGDTSVSQEDVGNYTPPLTSDSYGVVTQQNPTLPQFSQNITYSGNLMCVVKQPYADVKPISSNDNYSPACSPLVGGTMDYIVSESTGYNSDEDEVEYYYDLASGRKIKRDMVDLVSVSDMGDNSLEVLSVASGYGKIQITLKTDWKVPYNIDYNDQGYYYSYSKYFNVTSFEADSICMTFFHTTSVTGSIDVSGSNVLSGAMWSSSPSNKAVMLTMVLDTPGEYYGSSVEYDSSGNMVITINRKPETPQQSIVLLDPGHGGDEPGAVGLDSVVQERYINLDIAYQVKAELEKLGVTVYMTRTGNDKEADTLTLEQRKAIARSIKPDLYVSIHCNGSYNPGSIGTSTYYYEPFSYALAKNIYDEMLYVYRNHLYAGRQELYSDIADSVRYYPFSVTRIEDCPSTLIEVGYLTNDEECALLANLSNQALLAKAIADGIYTTLQG